MHGGLIQLRCRSWIPSPQETVQAAQSFHGLQPENFEFRFTFRKFSLIGWDIIQIAQLVILVYFYWRTTGALCIQWTSSDGTQTCCCIPIYWFYCELCADFVQCIYSIFLFWAWNPFLALYSTPQGSYIIHEIQSFLMVLHTFEVCNGTSSPCSVFKIFLFI